MRISMVVALTAASMATSLVADERADVAKRLDAANTVLNEIMGTPDKGIPQDLLDKAQCVVVVPSVKRLGLVFGGKYGRGFTTCRKAGAGWGAPEGVKVEGGSVGFQIGGSETDVVLLVMNKSGAEKLLQSKFTLGAGAEVAAGPVGRDASAETDAMMRAEILSYSRSRGVFAGITLSGATLRPDKEANIALYGGNPSAEKILMGGTPVPAEAMALNATLDKYSMHKDN